MIRVPKGAVKASKRLGRGQGSGTGCTAGKGTKGQKARSGGKVKVGFEGGQMPLYRRVPSRGFSNYPFKQKPVVISLGHLETAFDKSETINLQALKDKKIIRNRDSFVKVLAMGEIKKAITLSNELSVSASAKEKIIAAGGSVEAPIIVEPPRDSKGKLTKKVYRKQQALENKNKVQKPEIDSNNSEEATT